jgi:hypothetical protein
MCETNTIKKVIQTTAAIAFWSTVFTALYVNILYANRYYSDDAFDL